MLEEYFLIRDFFLVRLTQLEADLKDPLNLTLSTQVVSRYTAIGIEEKMNLLY
jgi:hypothetical protein